MTAIDNTKVTKPTNFSILEESFRLLDI